ncbi:MAG: hypothetical protein VYC17_04975 [Nitrospinota bacterium]|nr:hypothetical protein [Nitrospinota bacterium]
MGADSFLHEVDPVQALTPPLPAPQAAVGRIFPWEKLGDSTLGATCRIPWQHKSIASYRDLVSGAIITRIIFYSQATTEGDAVGGERT